MTTKKFNTFEYAGEVFAGLAAVEGLYRQESFETPYGHVIVLASHEDDEEKQARVTGMAIERIRYYLEHETDDDAAKVSQNALVYTSGYIDQVARKDPGARPGKLSCLCVLFHDEKIYYARLGDVCLFVMAGKKIHALLPLPGQTSERVQNENNYMGLGPLVHPDTAPKAFEPVDGDMLLMGAGSVCRYLHTRAVKKILQDSMPAKTKVSRVLRFAGDESGQQAAALVTLCFYNLDNTERKWPESHHAQGEKQNKKRPGKPGANKRSKVLKGILATLGFVLVSYMFYELFIYDPHPAVDVPVATEPVEPVLITQEREDTAVVVADTPPPLPDDVPYTVRTGDTWGRIYNQFGVCSWFIINHTPNRGRFGREGSLIAGERLRIPVKYSGFANLNPHYYTEFTTDKVGSTCQHAGREFLEAFEKTIQSQ